MTKSNRRNTVCLRHIAEVFLYEYFVAKNAEYEISEEDTLTPYKEKAREYEASGDVTKARDTWVKAHFENPVDMESFLAVISCCKQLGDIDGAYAYTTDSYPFCCTRAELAAYYRNLGWYYLEKYEPDVAVSCYMYSQYFDKTKQAEDEIKFLEKALGKTFDEKSPQKLQTLLMEKDIPATANSVTLALLYRAGEEAEAAGEKLQALDCYRMVYDLTADEEIGYRIDELVKE